MSISNYVCGYADKCFNLKFVSAHTGSLFMHKIRAELAKILKPFF